MKLSRSLLLILLTFALSSPAYAFDSALNTTPAYIQTDSLPPQLLPSPPQENTAEWQKQISEVLTAQKNISTNDIAAIKDEQHLRLDLMTSQMGDDFTRDKLPKTFALLDHVLADASRITETDKHFWHTRRPYLTDKRVKLYIDPIDSSPSFPSGHTSEMRVLAEVLGMLQPEKLADLRVHAEAIAYHRVEAGAHYPNDLEGGRLLAMLIVGSLTANEDFQDDLKAARKEMAERSS